MFWEEGRDVAEPQTLKLSRIVHALQIKSHQNTNYIYPVVCMILATVYNNAKNPVLIIATPTGHHHDIYPHFANHFIIE